MAVATVASLSTAAFADSCANSFSGFYAGLQAGMNSTTGKLNIDGYAADMTNDSRTSAFKGSIGKKSFLGGIFAGYGMGVGSCAYVGGELSVNFGNASDTIYDTSNTAETVPLGQSNKNFRIKMQRNYTLGAKIRLGYTVSPQAMIFVGLGLERAKLQLQSENVYGDTTAAGNPQTGIALVVKKNKAKISFAPSIGMDMFLNKNVFLRGEYTYVIGLNQKIEARQRTVNVPGRNITATIKANMTQQRFTLGLGYKF